MAEQSSSYWNILTFVLTAIVSSVVTWFIATRKPAEQSGGPPSIFSRLGFSARDAIAYLPHLMLLFGVIADAITYEGVYSIPSLIALITVPLNWLMKYFWAGVASVFEAASARPAAAAAPAAPAAQAGGGKFSGDYDGCEVQGLEFMRSKYAPQTFVITSTIFFYYILDLISNRGWINATGAIVLFGVLYTLQGVIVGDCVKEENEPGRLAKWLMSLTEGLLFGGTSYGIVQAYFPQRLPSSSISIFPRKIASELAPAENGKMKDSSGLLYTCLPSGQCIPDLEDEESRAGFADAAAKILGATGARATGGNCPAK